MKRFIAALLAFLLAVLTLGLLASPASAEEPALSRDPEAPTLVDEIPDGFEQVGDDREIIDNCISIVTRKFERTTPGVDAVTHDEFQFKREVPAVQEVSHMEYRYRREVPQSHEEPVYGYQKYVKGKIQKWKWKRDVRDSEKKLANVGKSRYGEWQNDGSFDWEPWIPTFFFPGPTGEHDHSAQLGDIYQQGQDNTFYRKMTTKAKGVKVQTGTKTVDDPPIIEYFPSADGFTTETPVGDGWEIDDEKMVIDQEYIAPFTEYYVEGGEPSLNAEDASWVESDELEGWVRFNERTVTDEEAIPGFTEYVYTESKSGEPCPTTTTTEAPEDPQVEVLGIQVEAETLAYTGGETVRNAVIGAGVLAVGVALILVGRRRKVA